MSAVRLSICIPVHNFGLWLPETLESIVGQAPPEVELVIVDGASTDDTPDVVRRFQLIFPGLRYERRSTKGGIDRDMARTLELASGEYCWLFSGDDIMRPGAIARVLAELSLGCDVYLLESMLCRRDMTPIGRHGILEVPEATTFRLDDPGERLEYFRRSRNTAAFFAFCSSLVVRKVRWDATPIEDSWFGTCWAHAARILSMIPAGLAVRYVPDPLLAKRGENDSFLTDGLTRRLALAVDGYHRIADDLFGHDSPEASLIRRALRRELPLSVWGEAKIEMARGRPDTAPELRRLIRKQYSDRGADKWKGVALLLTPAFALRALRFVLAHGRRLVSPAARPAAAARRT